MSRMADDLAKSGLQPADLHAQEAGVAHLSAVGLTPNEGEGYVIPYWDVYGKPLSHYRIRIFDSKAKYLQPKDSGNYIYFPKGLLELLESLKAAGEARLLLVCEGEKKAAACVKNGIPAIAFGGVDSWRNRTWLLPANTGISKTMHGAKSIGITVKLPAGMENLLEGKKALANGFTDFISLVQAYKLTTVICYDRDMEAGQKFEVKRAAAVLAFEMRLHKVPFSRIKNLVLAPLPRYTRTAVDDYFGEGQKHLLEKQLEAVDTLDFPIHPNIRDMIDAKLRKPRLNREEKQFLALSVLADIDTNGFRLVSSDTGQTYYFNGDDKALIKTSFTLPPNQQPASPFGIMMYRKYGIASGDRSLTELISSMYHAEEPLRPVSPHRILAPDLEGNRVRYQINNGQYVEVTSAGIVIKDNGTDGCLFEADKVNPVEGEELRKAIDEQPMSLVPYWQEVIESTRLQADDQMKAVATILPYVSPWLFRWRGTQLPVEIVVGEAGSGKSSLLEHRLNVLVGKPELRNAPSDMKDWGASVASTGGLHVTDNVQLLDKNFKQKLSDEMCRIVTSPQPKIEARKLYSDGELTQLPANVVFALTAVSQPFYQTDLLQRSIVFNMDKGSDTSFHYDSNWTKRQMDLKGGRVQWIAHHLVVLRKFFALVESEWNPEYQATHRLINFEQSMIMMGKVLGIDVSWFSEWIRRAAISNLETADWAMEGLVAFAKMSIGKGVLKGFGAKEISLWAAGAEQFSGCQQLTDPRRLGRHLKANKQTVAQVTGLIEDGTHSNRTIYRIEVSPEMQRELDLKQIDQKLDSAG